MHHRRACRSDRTPARPNNRFSSVSTRSMKRSNSRLHRSDLVSIRPSKLCKFSRHDNNPTITHHMLIKPLSTLLIAFLLSFDFRQPAQTPSSSGDQAPTSSDLIRKKGAHDLYSTADELTENDKCSFMAAKFEANKIPLMPPPKECC